MSTPKIVRFPASAPIGDIAEAIMRDGAAIAEGVISPDVLGRFNAELDVIQAKEPGPRQYMNDTVASFFGENARNIPGVTGKSGVFLKEILCHPLFVGLCEQILRPNCSTYQVNFANIMERGPGAPEQLLHRDDGVWPHFPRPLPYVLEFAMMMALGEFTADIGATRIVPGSHLWDPERLPEPHEIVVAEMEPGSAAFYLGETIHAGGANKTNRWRRGMHLSYCLGWLRTEENNYLIAQPDLVRDLPRQVQAMIGYGIHDAIERNAGFLGAVDWRDPLDLLAEGKL